MSCDCRKFAPDPDCTRREHTMGRELPSPAFYEERIRLLSEENQRLRRKVAELRRELEAIL